MTETVHARCQNRPEMRTDGMAPPTRFGEVIAADHTVLSEDHVSRLQHRYAVVVQKMFFSYWITSYPTRNKVADDTRKSLQTVPAAFTRSQE